MTNKRLSPSSLSAPSHSHSRSPSHSYPTSPPTTSTTTTSRPPSPVSPAYEPLTPTLAPVRTFTHTTHPPSQTFIPPPRAPPEVIDFDHNPDVLALRSTLGILQLQRQRALADMRALGDIKARGLAAPEEFVAALQRGELSAGAEGAGEWGGGVPKEQSVVRMPPVNWTQYGVVGESLEKIHRDQVARPVDGVPARVEANGSWTSGVEGGVRRTEPYRMAAPFDPLKDRLENPAKKVAKK